MPTEIKQKEKALLEENILERNRLKDLEECKLCAHLCKVNRNEGQIGRCKAGKTVKIVSVFIQILPMLKSDLCTVWLRDLYPENPGKINSFTDLASGDYLLCIGNDDVPVGAYSLEILDYLGYSLDQLEDQGKVTYASNVSEVARQVQEGVVDAGMVYATDASTYGLNVVDAATPEMCQQVIYPAAVMKSGEADSYDAAEDFLTYLYTNEEAISVWKDVGFTLIAQGEN